MCGIFGVLSRTNAGLGRPLTERVIRELFTLSETRGKESSGIAIRSAPDRTIHVTKDDVPATRADPLQGLPDFPGQGAG
jgi:glutamine phosphoribosylpyrophosphate amidotransferase